MGRRSGLMLIALATACADGGGSGRGGVSSFGDPSGTGSSGPMDPTSEISAANASGTEGATTMLPDDGTTGEAECGVDSECVEQDADLCTVPRCVNQVCIEEPLSCAPPADACSTGECNPATGMCETRPVDGGTCDDGNPCTTDDTCVAGTCEGTDGGCVMPDHAVISELLYDDPDADNDVWIEVWAPPGSSLDGLRLEFVNGNGGAVQDTLTLSGTAPDDGLVLIVDPSSTDASLTAKADVIDTFADLQNGPDNVRLMDGATVVDAVGYGDFGASDTFAGEGQPAPDAEGSQSVGRLSSFVDTDDNAADFRLLDPPTPGEINL